MPSKDKKVHHKKTKHEIESAQTIEQAEVSEEKATETDVQIIEKIVYKKQRVHGFFRTLTIIVLLVIGFLMLGESVGIAKVTIGNFSLNIIYPLVVIFSTIVIRSYKGLFGKLFGLLLFLGVFGGFFTIRIYNGLDENTKTTFAEPIAFEITGNRSENISIKNLANNLDLEGNTKSPYLQGTRTSDRDMLTSRSTTGGQETLLIQENNTLNLLQDFVSQLTLFTPSKTDFQNIYIRNARGTENINTQDLNRHKMTLHGGINKIVLDINNVPKDAVIEIQGAVQDITINIPQGMGVQMKYRNKIGYKSIPEFTNQTGHLYTSNNIAQAKKILNININIFMGRLQINWK
ncbi:MAG: LiaF-related protein [candidate division SR1 bacterium]|nr:LiaF-related protein [candidate division SR1 bacterium]